MITKPSMRAFLLGGLLPIIAFTVIEEYYGPLYGVIAGMVFGVGEIAYEWRTLGRVQGMTWAGNGLLLFFGAISILTNEGIWFKLQPAILEGGFALILWGSCLAGKPLLWVLANKQAKLPVQAEKPLGGLTVRTGVFFAVHAGLATWAALSWSTAAWAFLKGVGFTLSFIIYMVVESLLLRYRFRSKQNG